MDITGIQNLYKISVLKICLQSFKTRDKTFPIANLNNEDYIS